MYEVIVRKPAKKNADKQQPYIRDAFYKWVTEDLPVNPYENNDGKLVKTEHQGFDVYKKRFGAFRCLFTINDDKVIVEVFKFGSRGQSYKD